MNWTLPGDNSLSQNYFNDTSGSGMRALYQNMSDYFSGQGRNYALANWFNSIFPAEQSRFNAQAIQNPNLTWSNWLVGQQGQLMQQYNTLPDSLKGATPGFVHAGRNVW